VFLCIPKLLRHFGPRVAFGLPGLLMLMAILVFWVGGHHDHHVAPSGPDPDSVLG
jgi:POT family proton-dependent oligopeptide transporter